MKLIRQKKTTDCGTCCVAMIANKSYAEVENMMGSSRTDNEEIKAALLKYGKIKRGDKFCCKKSKLKRNKKVAMVKINLRNNGNWHWVVYDPAQPREKPFLDPYKKIKNPRSITDKKIVSYLFIKRPIKHSSNLNAGSIARL